MPLKKPSSGNRSKLQLNEQLYEAMMSEKNVNCSEFP
jgi:hypothetical protein